MTFQEYLDEAYFNDIDKLIQMKLGGTDMKWIRYAKLPNSTRIEKIEREQGYASYYKVYIKS